MIIEIIKKIHQEFADGFTKCDFSDFSDGWYFRWENVLHPLTNMCFTYTDQIVNELKERIKKYQLKLICNFDLHTNETVKKNDFVVLSLENPDVKEPLPMDFEFKKYSYNDKKKIFEINDILDKYIELHDEYPPNNKSFLGGLMHLFNGQFIAITNDDNIIAMGLVYSVENITIIDDIVCLKKFDEYLDVILAKISYQFKKQELFVLGFNNKTKNNKYYKAKFVKVEELRVYEYKV